MATFGETLRQARASKGVTLKEVEQATRINRHQLAALEEENFGALPALIYQRGIVRNYAAYLNLDPGKLLAMFDEARGVSPDVDVVAATRPLNMPSHWAPNFAIIAFMVVISAILFAWLYSAYFAPGEAAPTATQIIATVTPVPTTQLAMPTPVPPTAAVAPTATAKPKPKKKPTATATATQAPPEPTPTSQPEAAPPDAPAVYATTTEESTAVEAEPTSADQGDVLTISITASSDITLTVVGDGSTLFEGDLAAGDSTGPLSAQRFDVSTTDPAATEIQKKGAPDSFHMDSEIFELP